MEAYGARLRSVVWEAREEAQFFSDEPTVHRALELEPTTGLHPSDVERLVAQLERLVDAGNTVIIVEHDMRVVAGSHWVIDIGPGAGEEGGTVVAIGKPHEVAAAA